MIIIGLKSAGIGNCMFQYAAARNLAIRNNTILKLDLTILRKHQMPLKWESEGEIQLLFNESLGVFNIKYELANESEINKLRGWGDESKSKNRIIRKTRRILKIYPKSYFRERVIHEFDPSFFYNKENTYLEGTFINPNYFKDIENIIKKEFTFKYNPSGENYKLFNEIKSCESVSIHVRRGDYLNQRETKNIYPAYGVDYYKEAIKIILAKVENPKFFIFSDDKNWIKNNLKLIRNSIIVDYNPIKRGFEDLRLMINCKHNIISNSTFPWWAAWLNKNPQKIVIAPKIWRNDNKKIADLIQSNWYII